MSDNFLTLNGVEALEAILLNLAGTVSDERLAGIVQQGAEVIAEEARRLVPVVTGNLRDSITAYVTEASGLSVAAEVGSTEPYAQRIEFGFLNMTDSLHRTFHQAAQPWLRPAFDSRSEESIARMSQLLQTQLGAD